MSEYMPTIRGDEMFRDIVTPVVEFKSPASTPRVVRSPFVAPDSYVVMQAEMFEDAKPRVIVSSHLAGEECQKITDALEAFEREQDRIEKAFAAIGELFEEAKRRGAAIELSSSCGGGSFSNVRRNVSNVSE